MKKRVKKNQVIITALAVMIAVAGYLNYSGMKLEKETAAVSEGTVEDAAAVEEGVDDSSLVDVESWDLALNELETDLGEQEAASTEVAAEEAEGETQSGDTPGEAVLTSVTSGSSFAAEAKLSREQVRAKNKETLLEVINNENITEEQKQSAIDSMTAMTDQAEKEAAAELLLDSKGFVDSVVSITDGTVDELDDARRAQIEDIVKRKTEISGENIVITPHSGE